FTDVLWILVHHHPLRESHVRLSALWVPRHMKFKRSSLAKAQPIVRNMHHDQRATRRARTANFDVIAAFGQRPKTVPMHPIIPAWLIIEHGCCASRLLSALTRFFRSIWLQAFHGSRR